MSRDITRAADNTISISASIDSVAGAAESTNDGANESLNSALEITDMAAELQSLVVRFKVEDESRAEHSAVVTRLYEALGGEGADAETLAKVVKLLTDVRFAPK